MKQLTLFNNLSKPDDFERDTFIYEQNPESEDIYKKIKITSRAGQIWIDMLDDDNWLDPIAGIEIWEGELRVLVWANTESDEPTHIIPLNFPKNSEDNPCN